MEVFHDTATECHLPVATWDHTVLPANLHK